MNSYRRFLDRKFSAVRLGEHAFAVTVFCATAADFFITRPCLGADGCPVSGKGNAVRVYKAFLNGTVKKLFFIQAEDQFQRAALWAGQRMFFEKFNKAESRSIFNIRSFIPMFFAFWSFLFLITLFG